MLPAGKRSTKYLTHSDAELISQVSISIDVGIDSKILVSEILRYVDTQIPKYKAIFRLKFIELLKDKDISIIMDISEDQVGTVLTRIKQKLRTRFNR